MEILLLTSAPAGQVVLAALDLLPHSVRTAPRDVRMLVAGPSPEVVLVDARTELADARSTCRMLHATGLGMPLIAVVSEAGLVALHADWGVDDVMLATAGPAEVEARLRLAVGRFNQSVSGGNGGVIKAGELTIDPDTYAAKLKGRPLDLTYKEFELLKFLAQHPGRVFTRDQLLREVWGYDYFGGTRTVDVHVRRLRAKLGSEYESMIGTVRQVGYKFVVQSSRSSLSESSTGAYDDDLVGEPLPKAVRPEVTNNAGPRPEAAGKPVPRPEPSGRAVSRRETVPDTAIRPAR